MINLEKAFRSVPFRSVPFRSVPFRSVPFREFFHFYCKNNFSNYSFYPLTYSAACDNAWGGVYTYTYIKT